MNVRPSKAAQLAGARSTIYKDIEDGKLSATLDGKGRKVLDVAELERVYGALTTPADTEPSDDVHAGHIETDEKGTTDNTLRHEIAFLRERLLEKDERLREKDSTIEDLRGERDRLLTLLEEQTVSEAPDRRARAQGAEAEAKVVATVVTRCGLLSCAPWLSGCCLAESEVP